MTFIQKFTKYWLPVIFCMCFIFWMSTETFSVQNTSFYTERILSFLFPGISSQQVDLIHAFFRKAGHLSEYFILGLLLFRGFRGASMAFWNWGWSFLSLLVVVLWAAIDEFHQSFVPARTASLLDVGMDTAGGILALCVIALCHRHRKNRGIRSPYIL
jgi:VanZ family protein